jgi:hypothetical protein
MPELLLIITFISCLSFAVKIEKLKGVKPRAKIAKAFSDSAPSGTI